MSDRLMPDYGKYHPNTFALPDGNWPTAEGMTDACFACGDACHPDLFQFTLNVHGQISDTEPDGSTVGMLHRTACKTCYDIWSIHGYYGPEALDEYLCSQTRQEILDAEERARHFGVSYYRVIADRTYRSRSQEGVFADAWQDLNAEHRTLQRLMAVPCDETHQDARRIHDGLMRHPHYQRNAAGKPLTDRECAIVATAIQWLGTNVGFAWLQDTLREAGYELRQTKDSL